MSFHQMIRADTAIEDTLFQEHLDPVTDAVKYLETWFHESQKFKMWIIMMCLINHHQVATLMFIVPSMHYIRVSTLMWLMMS